MTAEPTMRPPPTPPARVMVACVLLFVVVVVIFWPALNNSYVNYDDPDYLINNLPIQSGLSLANMKWAMGATVASNWHPLTWVSHMLDCQIFGPKLWGHHLTNVLLHAVNAVLVFLLFQRATGSFWRSLMLAGCFGLHPLRVESVAWLSERKDVLSGCFGLAALIAYVSYAQKSRVAKVIPTKWPLTVSVNYLLILIFFALSLLSKPMMVTLPCVMLLLDAWPLQRTSRLSWSRLVMEKIPFFIMTAAVCVVTYIVQRSGGAMDQMSHYDKFHHLANALVSYLRYIGKCFWPVGLAPIYPVVEVWPIKVVAGAALLMAAITSVSIALRKRAGYAFVGWLWFLGTLVPVIGIVAVGEQAMADRYTYFTQLGIALLLIWGAAALTRGWHWQAPVAGVICAGLFVTCAVATRQQIHVWADSETLFRHTLAVTEDNYSAHANLAAALEERGELNEALFHTQEAVRLRPDSAESLSNFGAALARLGRLDEAIVQFEQAVRLQPNNAQMHQNLALALNQKGRYDEANVHLQEAARLNGMSGALR